VARREDGLTLRQGIQTQRPARIRQFCEPDLPGLS